MIQVKCTYKFKDKNNNIYGYRIQDVNGKTMDVQADKLKQAIRNNQVTVINLILTSDNRLIDGKKVSNKKKDAKLEFKNIIQKMDQLELGKDTKSTLDWKDYEQMKNNPHYSVIEPFLNIWSYYKKRFKYDSKNGYIADRYYIMRSYDWVACGGNDKELEKIINIFNNSSDNDDFLITSISGGSCDNHGYCNSEITGELVLNLRTNMTIASLSTDTKGVSVRAFDITDIKLIRNEVIRYIKELNL